MRINLFLLIILLATLPHAACAQNIVFPKDAGIANVLDYGAKGDGIADDTVAIQKALDTFPNAGKIIYLPEGTYKITDTLRWPHGTVNGAEEKNTILQGESRGGTTIRLADHAPGYTDPKMPKAMVWTGEKPAQRFRNAIRNLTFDTGNNNPGAIGVRFMANNQGCLRDVTIRAGDGVGQIGLDMAYTDEIGPLLVKNLRIVGFDYGIRTAGVVDSMTLENIVLIGQRIAGLKNDGQCLSIHNFNGIANAPLLVNTKGAGMVTLVDAAMKAVGATFLPAMVNEASLYARNIRSVGYARTIEYTEGRQWAEYVSSKPLQLFPGKAKALSLPVVETPEVPWDAPENWVSPTQFGITASDTADASDAIQKAIDTGKTTLYLPNGFYHLGKTVIIRGNIRRIIGCEAGVGAVGELAKSNQPLFRFADGFAPVVVMERLFTDFAGGGFCFLEHAAKRTLVLSSVAVNFQGASAYRNTGTGDLFIEDFVGGDLVFRNQRVWARQLNVENQGTHILNDGGTLWVLGLKTERGGTLVATRHGGRSEIVGGFCYTTTGGKLAPMFTSDDSQISVSIGESWFNAKDSPYTVLVHETKGKVTKILRRGQAPGRTGGSVIPLFVGGGTSLPKPAAAKKPVSKTKI